MKEISVWGVLGIVLGLCFIVVVNGCSRVAHGPNDSEVVKRDGKQGVGMETNVCWEECLTPEQYRVMREAGTERPGTGEYLHNKAAGMYVCAGCGNTLFHSSVKYDSGSGWPSFWQPVAGEAVKEKVDKKFGMVRTEVLCPKCDAHLGHVFPDGPEPTGLRYCINSVSLKFVPAEPGKSE